MDPTQHATQIPVTLSRPAATDGAAVHALIAACPPLDTNSVYCNLLQCSHFADTCAVAKRGEAVVGFMSGYLLPREPDTLFVWQVAVAESARGLGLSKRLLTEILERPACSAVRFLHTTITPDNAASEGLFRRIARSLDAELSISVAFDRDKHFGGGHETENLWKIGPFACQNPQPKDT